MIKSNHLADIRRIQVLGLMRSGNHAVIEWIRRNASEPQLFINMCLPTDCTGTFYSIDDGTTKASSADQDASRRLVEQLPTTPFVLCSFENHQLDAFFSAKSLEYPDLTFDTSILIIRDPFNWLASYKRMLEKRGQTRDQVLPLVVRQTLMWLKHASFASNPSAGTVVVRYEDWCSSTSYRADLLRRLSLDVIDNTRDQVAEFGSSFDLTREYAGRAEEMRTNERWLHLEKDADAKQIIHLCLDTGALSVLREWVGEQRVFEVLERLGIEPAARFA